VLAPLVPRSPRRPSRLPAVTRTVLSRHRAADRRTPLSPAARRAGCALAALAALAGAAPAARAQGGAPAVSATPAPPRHSAADAMFMRDMIGHHAQALAMTALVPARTRRADVRLVAERIDVSQRDELALMRRWLTDRGEPAPDTAAHAHHAPPDAPGAHDAHGAPAGPMPGMLTAAEMARLAAARGAEFDRLFVAGMIRHHEGALLMVQRLFATPGAAQEAETFGFASDVDADQRAEIARLRTLLRSPSARRTSSSRSRS
jgi:uncharacterized protein (DUF305 family)